jgi:hypothetical protein
MKTKSFRLSLLRGEGMGFFERKHLSDKNYSAVSRPESRPALQWPNGIKSLVSQQAAGRAACSVGVDADLRRVLCRAIWPAVQRVKLTQRVELYLPVNI